MTVKSFTEFITEDAGTLRVYHGSGTKFTKFSLKNSAQGIIWFTNDRDKILRKEAGAGGHGFLYTCDVTIHKPAGWKEYDQLLLMQ
jgi:hypothetical protein